MIRAPVPPCEIGSAEYERRMKRETNLYLRALAIGLSRRGALQWSRVTEDADWRAAIGT